MANIAKVVGGEVVVCNQYGGRLFSFRPSVGGVATFVDVHPSNSKMLVTIDSGKVLICNSNGGCLTTFDGNGKRISLPVGKAMTSSPKILTAHVCCEIAAVAGCVQSKTLTD